MTAKVLTAAGTATMALSGRRRTGAVAGGALLLGGAIYQRFAVFKAGFASARNLNHLYLPLMIVVSALVWGVVLFALLQYRARRGRAPSTKSDAKIVESTYALVLATIVAFLVWHTFTTEDRVDRVAAAPGLRVDVVAFKWQWRFTYPGGCRRRRHRRARAEARRPDAHDDPVLAHVARRHPCLLDPGAPLQARRVPASHDEVRPRLRPAGDVHGPLRRVLRPRPRRHDPARSRGARGRVPDLARGANAMSVRSIAYPQRERAGVLSWVAATDHKRVATLTASLSLALFLLSGFFAILMRLELALPGMQLLSHDGYNQLFTAHGSGMIYLVFTPLALALLVYLVPLQVGAAEIFAPRLPQLGYWLFALGALATYTGYFTQEGGNRSGWTAFVPLSDLQSSPGTGTDLWASRRSR